MFNNFHTFLNTRKSKETILSITFSPKFVRNIYIEHLSKAIKQIFEVYTTQFLRQNHQQTYQKLYD